VHVGVHWDHGRIHTYFKKNQHLHDIIAGTMLGSVDEDVSLTSTFAKVGERTKTEVTPPFSLRYVYSNIVQLPHRREFRRTVRGVTQSLLPTAH
jgi:hypothetical protein